MALLGLDGLLISFSIRISIIYGIGHDISSVSEDGSFSRKILSIDDNEGGGEARLLPSDFRPTGGFFDLLSLIP